jgi:betaine-aldehyde dehydrogenase
MTEDSALLDRVKRGRFLIGGAWIEPGERRRFDIVTPSDESIFASVPCATAQDIADAVAAAREAFDHGPWPMTSPAERGAFLHRLADAIDARTAIFAEIWAREVGGLITHGGFMVASSTAVIRDYAQLGTEFPFIERHTPTAGGNVGMLVYEPVGVVGAIIPWNGPILMLASKVAPALLAGCTVVVKMSPEAPLEAVLLGEICQELGLPPGVLNILMADREESELLVRNPDVDKISFTGSSAVGQRVASICGGRMARATLELGGKSAAVVLDDSPLEPVVEAIVPQLSMLGMQFCSALSRVIVPQHRHDALLDGIAAAMRQVKVGDPFDASTQMGPMSMKRQLERVEGYIESGKADGFTLATGGARPRDFNRGFYIEPTLFGHVPNSAKLAQEEVFGPVICVIPARDEEEAITLANQSDFGLNSAVFTADTERAMAVARRMRAGTVGHNAFRSDFGIAFGGFKKSGIGREGGRLGLMPYLEAKTVIMDAAPAALG